jgi:hypothetical protein
LSQCFPAIELVAFVACWIACIVVERRDRRR